MLKVVDGNYYYSTTRGECMRAECHNNLDTIKQFYQCSNEVFGNCKIRIYNYIDMALHLTAVK